MLSTSWSLVDSFWRKKPAWYTVKRDFAEIMVGISRTPVWHFVDENKRHGHPTDIPTFEIYASNLGVSDKEVELRLRMYDWSTHKEIALDETKATHTLKANQATEVMKLISPHEVEETSLIVLAATLHDANSGEEISRYFSWPEPYRYLLASDRTSVDISAKEDEVCLTCGPTPVKGALAYIDEQDGEDADWAENMIDLMPGETVKLPVKGVDAREVKCKWLYSWET